MKNGKVYSCSKEALNEAFFLEIEEREFERGSQVAIPGNYYCVINQGDKFFWLGNINATNPPRYANLNSKDFPGLKVPFLFGKIKARIFFVKYGVSVEQYRNNNVVVEKAGKKATWTGWIKYYASTVDPVKYTKFMLGCNIRRKSNDVIFSVDNLSNFIIQMGMDHVIGKGLTRNNLAEQVNFWSHWKPYIMQKVLPDLGISCDKHDMWVGEWKYL